MDPRAAALTVLRDAHGEALHWTVIWDRALRSGAIDPLADPDARDGLMRALSALAREGTIERTSTGTYRSLGSP